MEQKELSALTDKELLEEAKQLKSITMMNALAIGFLIGIIIYSVVKNTWGMLTLIPLYFVFKIMIDPKNKRSKDLQKLLKERNLK